MHRKRGRHGVSRAQWLEAALEVLVDGSVSDIKIDHLATRLGISKSGFYWHFQDKEDCLNQLLDYWTHEITEVVTKNPELSNLEPRERLCRIAEMILEYELIRFEIGIRQWALSNKSAAQRVEAVNKMRLDFVRQTLSELGFKGDDLEMRAMLFVCYHTWETPMFREIPAESRHRMISKRVELLTS